MAADRRSMNREAIEKFASHFDPPLQVVATEAVGGNRVAHGWMCALHLPEHEIGLTAVCWGKGHFKAWLEATGSRDEASFSGQVMAEIVDMLKRPSGPEAGESIDDEVIHPDRISPQTEQLEALSEINAMTSNQNRQPNPDFVDMMGLTPIARAKACDMYPELRFSINGNKRYDHDGNENDRAGFISSDQLEHVSRVIGDHKVGYQDPAACEHKFKKNAVGDGHTCIRCGVGDWPNTPDAAA